MIKPNGMSDETFKKFVEQHPEGDFFYDSNGDLVFKAKKPNGDVWIGRVEIDGKI